MKHYEHHLYRGLGLAAIFITKSRTAYIVTDVTHYAVPKRINAARTCNESVTPCKGLNSKPGDNIFFKQY